VLVAIGEHEVHWRAFLCGYGLLTSGDHSGLRAARLAVFGGVAW
jgi:hypothetical protein